MCIVYIYFTTQKEIYYEIERVMIETFDVIVYLG